ncbi:hypothetical protein [Dyella caseinilytica]|uniref:Uncharacterized protein n=1 Tax=Dyella caseinilytica TaxID=1849581 RepID=A0ABX7GT75_9GAMM|nr:hypothetical protein [Dyella caseinilytica]QRN53650.1 hypothetical protein ISN74_19985 [Dyella caseinilytica]GFZ88209.1 hypothetical protein GCM10011408_03590 [Dyella caseinilytica]
MSTKPTAETTIDKEGVNETPASPGAMHRPGHSALDTEDVAAHDELQHEAALRDSSLRVPR